MTPAPRTLDVRPELRSGGEPLPRILQAASQLQPGQALRLLTTFEPIPLYAVLGRKGFCHVASHHHDGDWEIVLTPGDAAAGAAIMQPPGPNHVNATSAAAWPAPKKSLDNRGLPPPEPMIRILEALEHLAAGEILEAINEREPMLLYPELEARGASIHMEKQPDAAVRLLIRRGG
jgi:uncharacterized protein (DUF2249 family)